MKIMEEFCNSRHLLHLSALPKLDGNLMNVATGLVAPESMKFIDVKECGSNVIKKMEESSLLSFPLRRNIKQNRCLRRPGRPKKKISIDPEFLFQRLIMVCSDDELNEALKYELRTILCPFLMIKGSCMTQENQNWVITS